MTNATREEFYHWHKLPVYFEVSTYYTTLLKNEATESRVSPLVYTKEEAYASCDEVIRDYQSIVPVAVLKLKSFRGGKK